MDLREELIQGLKKEYAAITRVREKLAMQLEALGVDVNEPANVTITGGGGGGGASLRNVIGGSGGGSSLNA